MILASASPRRRELLEACGIPVEVLPADIDEAIVEGETPQELVMRLACGKAHAALASYGPLVDDALLAADTIVWDDLGDVLGKPLDLQDAARMLRALSDRTHHVSTGVCIVVGDAGGRLEERSFVETTDVTFCDLSDEEIGAYVASGEPMDKAGAYGIQGLGRFLVKGIVGDYPNVVGLPINRTLRELDDMWAACGREGLVTTILEGKHG